MILTNNAINKEYDILSNRRSEIKLGVYLALDRVLRNRQRGITDIVARGGKKVRRWFTIIGVNIVFSGPIAAVLIIRPRRTRRARLWIASACTISVSDKIIQMTHTHTLCVRRVCLCENQMLDRDWRKLRKVVM